VVDWKAGCLYEEDMKFFEKMQGIEYIRNYLAYKAAQKAYFRITRLEADLERKKVHHSWQYTKRIMKFDLAYAEMNEVLSSGIETWQLTSFEFEKDMEGKPYQLVCKVKRSKLVSPQWLEIGGKAFKSSCKDIKMRCEANLFDRD
jgi:hypothetical protein